MGSFGGGSSPLPSLLISKHNLDLGTNGQRRILLEDLCWEHGERWQESLQEQEAACFPFASFSFQNKAGQPLESCCQPLCSSRPKNRGSFLTHPQREGLCHTGAEGPRGLLGVLAPFQNQPSLQEHRTEGWAKSLAFSYSSQRSLANLIPGKKMHQS